MDINQLNNEIEKIKERLATQPIFFSDERYKKYLIIKNTIENEINLLESQKIPLFLIEQGLFEIILMQMYKKFSPSEKVIGKTNADILPIRMSILNMICNEVKDFGETKLIEDEEVLANQIDLLNTLRGKYKIPKLTNGEKKRYLKKVSSQLNNTLLNQNINDPEELSSLIQILFSSWLHLAWDLNRMTTYKLFIIEKNILKIVNKTESHLANLFLIYEKIIKPGTQNKKSSIIIVEKYSLGGS